MVYIPKVKREGLEASVKQTGRDLSADVFLDALVVAACHGRFDIPLATVDRKSVFDCGGINCGSCMFKSKEAFLEGLLQHMEEET